MKVIERILTKNPCYIAGKKIDVKGLMLHSVGCPQPKAEAFISSWDSEKHDNSCVHAFIDGIDGNVYQTLPWDHRGWHAGGAANNTHIGVEMCEPACIKYISGSTFECSDDEQARVVAERIYKSAVELFAMLCNLYNLDPLADGVIISHAEGYKRGVASNHGDPEHLWRQLDLPYTMDTFRRDVSLAIKNSSDSGLQATAFENMSEADVIKTVGPLFTKNQKECGILASVSLAQFILESGYGKSELAQNANNCFGMKKSLSGNTWKGSTWDGISVYTKKTQEQHQDGTYESITADFRKYKNIYDSIADHSAYLLGAKNGRNLRYKGIGSINDYKEAAKLIKAGGYATSLSYVEKLCDIIERWNLTQYDLNNTPVVETPEKQTSKFPAVPFMVRVIIDDLNYRSEPSMKGVVRGQTRIGTFTIVDVCDGWGKLKSGAGWIYLENPNYCTILNAIENKSSVKKSIDEIAKEVIKGDWGNGTDRKARLTAAGYDYAAIQHRVNKLLL